MSTRPTPEQLAAVEAFAVGGHVVLQAGAGSGKTTTLVQMARRKRRPGQYLVFNRSIADGARRRFPRHVGADTAHSLAYQAVGWRYAERLAMPCMSSAKLAAVLGPTGTRWPKCCRCSGPGVESP
ncbi:UvrD-helicase domain-containing protein [Saccharothrix variisporea]|uniref:UvrD/REP helicase N-terminal domain-containing protein n=1 Tax=Saccharothrix variisporea TaxID=543527 RepID=A0A495XMM5_9PSEU|nr:UvrD-helicase domain-containing protein [Saccharothrix variisporea]RKT74455.1 UvrD/REP helicase N-terminal domain-containing protein [Saccharothrix variisporea]